jgi:hypothetical protein
MALARFITPLPSQLSPLLLCSQPRHSPLCAQISPCSSPGRAQQTSAKRLCACVCRSRRSARHWRVAATWAASVECGAGAGSTPLPLPMGGEAAPALEAGAGGTGMLG